MTQASGSTWRARAGGAGDVHGLAVLLVGTLLAAGTALSHVGTGAPAFPEPAAAGSALRTGEAVREKVLDQAGRVGALPAARVPTRLDLNAASAEALQSLPGIGPVLAKRIVADREAHGPFRTPEDLLGVPGVGAKRLDRIRALVRLTGEP
jgi:competence protein ComEA